MLDWDSLPCGYSLRMVLIRHGEPEPETKGRCYGNLDVGLSQAGRSLFRAKLGRISNLRATHMYASPLKRALESAAIAGACWGLQATTKPELQEINFGRFEGLTYKEIEELYPDEYKRWMESPTEVRFPQGESFSDLKTRVNLFRRWVLSAHQGETVVIVSHSGPNRILLAEALGLPDPMIFRIDQSYAAINIIDYFQDYPVVRLVNG